MCLTVEKNTGQMIQYFYVHQMLIKKDQLEDHLLFPPLVHSNQPGWHPFLTEMASKTATFLFLRSENEQCAPVEGKIYSAAASVKPDTWSLKVAIKICGLCGMKHSHVGEKPFSDASSGELLKTA